MAHTGRRVCCGIWRYGGWLQAAGGDNLNMLSYLPAEKCNGTIKIDKKKRISGVPMPLSGVLAHQGHLTLQKSIK